MTDHNYVLDISSVIVYTLVTWNRHTVITFVFKILCDIIRKKFFFLNLLILFQDHTSKKYKIYKVTLKKIQIKFLINLYMKQFNSRL